MSFLLNNEMMREIIMDHYQNPRNKREADDSYKTVYMNSVSCVDKIYIQLKEENGKIVDVCWHGNGCAISTASTSIMTELLKDKTVEEANKIMDAYNNMIYGRPYDDSLLDEAIVFVNTSRQPSRINCATIGWRGVNRILNGDDKDGGK